MNQWRETNLSGSSPQYLLHEQEGSDNSCPRETSDSSPSDYEQSEEGVQMVSRRAILHRSRDDMQSHLVGSPQDQWFSRERLYKDHINEVLGKWTNIEDSIWAKVIVLERNRRIAKAYARTPVLTINGSQDGFDGYRIGLNGFSNPLRDSKVAQVKEEVGAGCKLKMDEGGNILVKRVDNGGVYVKNTAEETAVSNDILKLPGGLLEKDRAMKLFDMKKFQQNINREMKRQRPERNKLESQCISTLAFVRSEMDILDCPIWVMVINIVALEMLGDRMPTPAVAPKCRAPVNYHLQTLRPQIHSSSDEDPYSLTQSGSSGYSGIVRDRDQFPNSPGTDPDEFGEIFPSAEQMYYTTLARQSRRDNNNLRSAQTGYEGEDPYYSGYRARVTDFTNKNKRERAHSKDVISGDKSSGSPWWHSRLYPDSGVELSSVGSGGSPAINTKPGRRQKGTKHQDLDSAYFPGLLRNGGIALKTKELSSYQPEKRKEYSNFFTTPRSGLFRQGWE